MSVFIVSPFSNEPKYYGSCVVGLPSLRYYGADRMSTSKLQRLKRWHTEENAKQQIFDQDREIIDYCRNNNNFSCVTIITQNSSRPRCPCACSGMSEIQTKYVRTAGVVPIHSGEL